MRVCLFPSLLLLALVGCDKTTGGGDASNTEVNAKDTDGDSILDVDEGFVDPENEAGLTSRDFDGDGTPDFEDLDSDEDGIPDADEAGDKDPLTLPWDSDVDGAADFIDLDADGNCIPDAQDGTGDLDKDKIADFHDTDDDGDGLIDVVEIGAECSPIDSDGDGTSDYHDDDSDADGVGDKYEAGTSTYDTEPRDTDGDGTPDYLDADSDGDGYTDLEEGKSDTPADAPKDTDGDGTYDFADTDDDGDGLDTAWEASEGLNPYSADSDHDGFTDGAEVAADTDPTDPGSVIDGVYVTVPERTSVEQDFDFTLNVQLGDVVFLLDTTGSMSALAQGMANQFNNIVGDISATLPDAEYGFATYDDYAYGSYGSSATGDKPFELRVQLTDDTSKVSSKLGAIQIHGGGDTPESSMEALHQAMTGEGYDQNCNGHYDSSTDVKPFLSSSSDPFSGAGGQFYDASISGTGDIGGFGFRSYALPVVVYATDAALRDPESGYGSPKGCPQDAGKTEVVNDATSLGAYLIGIAVSGSAPTSQMNQLADATKSFADTDGDGSANDRLVFSWNGGSSSTLRTTIVNAVEDLVSSVQFSSVKLQVSGDEFGFVTKVDPEEVELSSSASGQVITFTLNFRGAVAASEDDQVYKLTLDVLGDGTVLLSTLDIFVVVPGREG